MIRVARAGGDKVVIYQDGCNDTLTVPDHIWQQFHNAIMAGQYKELLFPRHHHANHRQAGHGVPDWAAATQHEPWPALGDPAGT